MNRTDVFLCYRRRGAQTAKLMKRYLRAHDFPGDIWYSDEEPQGNYRTDIPRLIGEAECAVMFIDPAFTDGFLDGAPMECITALEVTEIARKMALDPNFAIITVYLDRNTGLTAEESACLSELFSRAGFADPQAAVLRIAQHNTVFFSTATGDEDDLFDRVSRDMVPGDYYRRHIRTGNFYFGSLPTQLDLVVWDSGKKLTPEDITFSADPSPVPLYDRIRRTRENLTYEVQNNIMVSLVGADISLTDNDEQKKVSVRYRKTEYRLFYKTLMLWEELGLDSVLADYDPESSAAYPIPNAMGMAFMVITADGCLVFSQRSRENRRIRPGEFDCSVVEGLKIRETDPKGEGYCIDDECYLRSEIVRAFREEVCGGESGISILINGLALDRKYGQWNIIGVVDTTLTSGEIIRRHALREDTYEKQKLFCVPFRDAGGALSTEQLVPFMRKCRREGMWDMALAVTASALRHVGFSTEDIVRLSELMGQ